MSAERPGQANPPAPLDRIDASTAEAVLAVSRLLGAAAEASGPDVVRRALLREACSVLDLPAGAVLQPSPAGRGERHMRVAASAPRTSSAAPIDLVTVPAVAEIVDGRATELRLRRGEASGLAAAIGLNTHSYGEIVLLAMRADSGDGHVLALATARGRELNTEELDVASALADAAAASLAQLHLAEQSAAQRAQQATFTRAAAALKDSLDMNEALTAICREAAAILDADTAAVYRGNARDGVTIDAAWNVPPEIIGYHQRPGSGMAAKAVEIGRSILTNEYQRIANAPPGLPFARISSSLAVPLQWEGQIRGVLTAAYTRPFTVTSEHLRILEPFAELVASAYRNASEIAGLARAAHTDSLTGCLNHAAMHRAIEREMDRAERGGRPVSLILIDLDDFKQINDARGHLGGDEVLRTVGLALRQSIRPYDAVARYGGDEFAIVAADADERAAQEVAQRALHRVERAGPDTPAAATAGVAEWSPGMSVVDLIQRADRALLLGKLEGRKGTVIPASTVPDDGSDLPADGRAERVAPALPGADPWPSAEARQSDRLRKRTRQLAVASELGTRIAAMTEVEPILEAAVEELRDGLGFDLSEIARIRADGYVEHAAGATARTATSAAIPWAMPRSAGIIGRALRERRVVIVDDTAADHDFVAHESLAGAQSELVAPIWLGDRLWGAVNLEDDRRAAFDEDDAQIVRAIADQIGAALRGANLYEQLDRAYLGTAEALSAALEAKNSYTTEHAPAIARHATEVGRRLGFSDQELRDLRYGAIFHDIGKIAVPEWILNKPEPLTAEERDIVERHTVVGEQILAPVEFLSGVRPLVRHGHEHWDGTGYPDGLHGEQIPLGARVILACDAYHAMTSDRPYRVAMSDAEAREELRRNAGAQFDPAVVDALMAVLDHERALSRAATIVPGAAVARSGASVTPA